MDHDPYFDPPPSGGGDVGMGAPAAEPKLDVDTRDILPDLGAGSKRQRSPPRHDYDRDPGQDRSPRRRRFDGPPPGFDQRLDNGNGRPVGGGGGRGGRGRGKGTGRDDEGPLSFREFCVRHVSDTTTPAEAEQKYETYRKERADSFRARNFERPGGVRDDPKIRAAHDPRVIEEALVRRAQMAKDEARVFADEITNGTLAPLPVTKPKTADVDVDDAGEPKEPTEEGTVMDTEESGAKKPQSQKKDSRGRWPVPDASWAPTRLARDLRACQLLVTTLNAEKAVDVTDVFGDAEAISGTLTARDPIPFFSRLHRKPGEAEEDVSMDASTGDGTGGVDATLLAIAVDKRVAFLWRVHGVDYYAGEELGVDQYVSHPPCDRYGPDERCLTRGPCPGDDALAFESKAYLDEVTKKNPSGDVPVGDPGGGDDTTAQKSKPPGFTTTTAKWALRVDRVWGTRVEDGDKALAKCGRARVETELEAWKQSCVVRHEENRFGCTLSSKMFIAIEFVMKHIAVKQAPAVEYQRGLILDAIYMENYLHSASEEERSSRRERRERKGDKGARGNRPRLEMRAIAKSIVKEKTQVIHGSGKPVSKSYTDLDAPKVDRVVLDYGDI
jgi:hypothetical protein